MGLGRGKANGHSVKTMAPKNNLTPEGKPGHPVIVGARFPLATMVSIPKRALIKPSRPPV